MSQEKPIIISASRYSVKSKTFLLFRGMFDDYDDETPLKVKASMYLKPKYFKKHHKPYKIYFVNKNEITQKVPISIVKYLSDNFPLFPISKEELNKMKETEPFEDYECFTPIWDLHTTVDFILPDYIDKFLQSRKLVKGLSDEELTHCENLRKLIIDYV